MRIAIYTLGCKLNQAESDELKENLQKEGFFVVEWKSKADIYIVNACSLTHGAEQGTRQIIRQAHHRNQKAKIFVTGCFEQKIPEVDYYSPNQNQLIMNIKKIQHVLSEDLWSELRSERGHCIPPTSDKRSDGVQRSQAKDMLNFQPTPRTRAFIKIQTGCDNYCSFCIIPYFRGKPKSVSAAKIIKAVNQKVAQGFREVVLTGVNIYKYNWHGLNIVKLVKKILNETAIQRIRFGSLDPSLIDDEFVSLFQNLRVMPHMHLSLQSGSNKILRSMNRKYTAGQYLALVQRIKKQFPNFGFTTDVIVGFPGETDKDFQNTCDLVRKVKFFKVHIFPYSPRKGTLADSAENQISKKTKRERFNYLKKIADTLRSNFVREMIGQTVSVLFEEKRNGLWYGYTPNYFRIKFKSKENLKNKIKNIIITPQNLI